MVKVPGMCRSVCRLLKEQRRSQRKSEEDSKGGMPVPASGADPCFGSPPVAVGEAAMAAASSSWSSAAGSALLSSFAFGSPGTGGSGLSRMAAGSGGSHRPHLLAEGLKPEEPLPPPAPTMLSAPQICLPSAVTGSPPSLGLPPKEEDAEPLRRSSDSQLPKLPRSASCKEMLSLEKGPISRLRRASGIAVPSPRGGSKEISLPPPRERAHSSSGQLEQAPNSPSKRCFKQ